jgi:hypothetical protein
VKALCGMRTREKSFLLPYIWVCYLGERMSSFSVVWICISLLQRKCKNNCYFWAWISASYQTRACGRVAV